MIQHFGLKRKKHLEKRCKVNVISFSQIDEQFWRNELFPNEVIPNVIFPNPENGKNTERNIPENVIFPKG